MPQQAAADLVVRLTDRLFNGETKGFLDSVDTLIAAYQAEVDLFDSQAEGEEIAEWKGYIKSAQAAKAIYENVVTAAEQQAAKTMSAIGDLEMFASALESDDYSKLAF